MLVENKIELRSISDIKPYVRNPRENEKTVELLCELIPQVGFNVPIVIDENGIIVKGHARYRAAIKLGMKQVPCIVSHADEEAIKVDRITDNKIAEFSEWQQEDLQSEIEDMEFDLSNIGLPKISLDEVPSQEDVAEGVKGVEGVEDVKAEIGGIGGKPEGQGAGVIPKPVPKYFKCVCEKCGHVMFLTKADILKRKKANE